MAEEPLTCAESLSAENHGGCVSLAAKNKGSKGGTHPTEALSINYTQIQYVNASQ